MPALQIQPMASSPELLPLCARWNLEAFGESTGWELDDVIAGFEKIIAQSSGEMGLIAHYYGTPAGFVLLIDCDLKSHSHLKPWLASLVVSEKFRHRGIGSALVAAVEEAAAQRGDRQLFLYTPTPEFYRPLGWRFFEVLEKGGRDFEIMSKQL